MNINYLLLAIKHGESQYEIIFSQLIIRTRVLYYVNKVIKLYSFLSVRKLHHRRGARIRYLIGIPIIRIRCSLVLEQTVRGP